MALSLKDAETDRLAREVAKLTGESLTEAVRKALAERLERERRKRGRNKSLAERLDRFFRLTGAEVVGATPEQVETACEALRRYGKGRHPAGLNFGDVFAYALAKITGEPLLFKGDDFGRTDIASAA